MCSCDNGSVSNAPQTPSDSEPQGRSAQEIERVADEVRVRRAPKYPVFIFGGIIIGIIVTFIAVSVAPGRNDDNTPFLQAFGYFVLYGLAIGACVGSLVAILIDAEQYLSCDRLIARSTVAGFRFLPVTVK